MAIHDAGMFTVKGINRLKILQDAIDRNLHPGQAAEMLGITPRHCRRLLKRRGLRIHHIGEQGELIDTLGHFRESYQLAPGQCVVIRPDGYVGAFFHGKQSNDIENYLSRFAIGIKDEY